MDSEQSFMDFSFIELAQTGCFSVLNLALENWQMYNLDVNSQDKDGNTMLHYVAAKGNVEIMRKLFALKAYPSILNLKVQTPLHWACFEGHLNVAKILVLEHKVNINAVDYVGETCIFKAIRSGNTSLCRFLIRSGANIKHTNKVKETALHTAVKFGNVNVTENLLKLGGHIDQRTSYGDTAIHLAVRNYHDNILELLLHQKHIDVNTTDVRKRNILHLAVKSDQVRACEKILKTNINVNTTDIDGYTPLHYAAEIRSPELVLLLLKAKAAINMGDVDGYTALHIAASLAPNNNTAELIKFLIKYGADLRAKTSQGDLAIHRAAASGNHIAAGLLYKAKCITCRNHSGYTPLDLAIVNGNQLTSMMLESMDDNQNGSEDEQHNMTLSNKTFIIEEHNNNMMKLRKTKLPIPTKSILVRSPASKTFK